MKKILATLLSLGLLSLSINSALAGPSPLSITTAISEVYGEQNRNSGEYGVEFIAAQFICDSRGGCLIDELTFQGFIDEDASGERGAFKAGTDNGVAVRDVVTAMYLVAEDGTFLSSSEAVSADGKITFEDDFTLDRGESTIVTLKGNLSATTEFNGDSENIAFRLSGPRAVIAEDLGTGSMIRASVAVNQLLTTYINVDDEAEFTVAFNGPSASTFTPGDQDVSLMDFTFTASDDVEVRKLSFYITATGDGLMTYGAANYTDIKLINSETGEVLMGPEELDLAGSDYTQQLVFNDSWFIDNGESINASLLVDIANNPNLDSDTLSAFFSAISTTEGVIDLDTGYYISNFTPSTSIQGSTHRISI